MKCPVSSLSEYKRLGEIVMPWIPWDTLVSYGSSLWFCILAGNNKRRCEKHPQRGSSFCWVGQIIFTILKKKWGWGTSQLQYFYKILRRKGHIGMFKRIFYFVPVSWGIMYLNLHVRSRKPKVQSSIPIRLDKRFLIKYKGNFFDYIF